MMSRYKTPIRIQLDSSRKINEITHKYKLPFKKDVSSIQQTFSANKPEDSFISPSQIKSLPQEITQKEVKKSKDQLKSQPSQNDQQITPLPQQQNLIEEQQNIIQLLNTPNKRDVSVKSKKVDVENSQDKKQKLKLQRSLQMKIRSSSKNQADIRSNRKEKYNLQANRYTEQDVKNADELRQSDKDPIQQLKNSSKDRHSRKRYNSKPKNTHKSLGKAQVQSWQLLSKSTEKRQSQNYSVKEKVLRKLLKRSRQNLNQSEMSLSNVIANKFAKLTIQKPQKKDELYDYLPTISQFSEVQKLSEQQQEELVRKLLQIISVHESQIKSKPSVTLESYKDQYSLIKSFNPFFKKINQLAGCMLLSVGKIKFLKPGDLLFTEGQQISHLSIIIIGKVSLFKISNPNNQLKGVGSTGESLGQEALFDETKPYHLRFSKSSAPIFYRLQAKAQTQLCILRINLRKFYKMCTQLSIIGQRKLYSLINNLFKVNYLKKNAVIYQQFKERLQTEIIGSLRKKGTSFFY